MTTLDELIGSWALSLRGADGAPRTPSCADRDSPTLVHAHVFDHAAVAALRLDPGRGGNL